MGLPGSRGRERRVLEGPRLMPNKCIKFAPVGRPTRKSEALLLAAYARR